MCRNSYGRGGCAEETFPALAPIRGSFSEVTRWENVCAEEPFLRSVESNASPMFRRRPRETSSGAAHVNAESAPTFASTFPDIFICDAIASSHLCLIYRTPSFILLWRWTLLSTLYPTCPSQHYASDVAVGCLVTVVTLVAVTVVTVDTGCRSVAD